MRSGFSCLPFTMLVSVMRGGAVTAGFFAGTCVVFTMDSPLSSLLVRSPRQFGVNLCAPAIQAFVVERRLARANGVERAGPAEFQASVRIARGTAGERGEVEDLGGLPCVAERLREFVVEALNLRALEVAERMRADLLHRPGPVLFRCLRTLALVLVEAAVLLVLARLRRRGFQRLQSGFGDDVVEAALHAVAECLRTRPVEPDLRVEREVLPVVGAGREVSTRGFVLDEQHAAGGEIAHD